MLGLQLPVNLSRLELRKEVIQLNSQLLPRLLDGLNLNTPNIWVQDMQELQSLIMLGVRKILNISFHVIHDGGEPLKHRINVLTGERQRRCRGGVAAGTRIPARIGVGQGNLLRCELQGVLGKALGASIGSECKRREEFDEEVATTTGAM
jgi:hypothetical protein